MPDAVEKRLYLLGETPVLSVPVRGHDYGIRAMLDEDVRWALRLCRKAYAALNEIESTEHTCCTEKNCDCKMIAAGALDEIRAAENDNA